MFSGLLLYLVLPQGFYHCRKRLNMTHVLLPLIFRSLSELKCLRLSAVLSVLWLCCRRGEFWCVSNEKLCKLARSVQPHPLHSFWAQQQHSRHCFKFNWTQFYYTVTSFKLSHIGQACAALNWCDIASYIWRAETLLFFSLWSTSVY